jgi:hypothetical protein
MSWDRRKRQELIGTAGSSLGILASKQHAFGLFTFFCVCGISMNFVVMQLKRRQEHVNFLNEKVNVFFA